MCGRQFIIDGKPIKKLFPILASKINQNPLIYLDNAATTQKPRMVIDSIADYYTKYNSNVHRGAHHLANIATQKLEDTRLKTANFINAKSTSEIIFTKGTTESINLIAQTFGEKYIQPGDTILVSHLEHHSNLVPWQIICKKYKANLHIIPLTETLELDIQAYKNLLDEKVKLVSMTYVSNALGIINPIKQVIELAHKNNSLVLIDGAQAVKHMPIDVQSLNCDFLAFSSHKMYGPMGVGVLYGKDHLLQDLPVWQAGGEMVKTVTYKNATYNTLPYKFEAGTPNVGDIIAFGEALEFIKAININKINAYETQLTKYAIEKLKQIKSIQILGLLADKANVISFISSKMHHYDIGILLDKMGIAIRTGSHCAEPIINYLNVTGTARLSIAIYNTFDDIDNFINNLMLILNKYGS